MRRFSRALVVSQLPALCCAVAPQHLAALRFRRHAPAPNVATSSPAAAAPPPPPPPPAAPPAFLVCLAREQKKSAEFTDAVDFDRVMDVIDALNMHFAHKVKVSPFEKAALAAPFRSAARAAIIVRSCLDGARSDGEPVLRMRDGDAQRFLFSDEASVIFKHSQALFVRKLVAAILSDMRGLREGLTQQQLDVALDAILDKKPVVIGLPSRSSEQQRQPESTFAAKAPNAEKIVSSSTAFQRQLYSVAVATGPFCGWLYGIFVDKTWTEAHTEAKLRSLADAVGEKYEPPKKKAADAAPEGKK